MRSISSLVLGFVMSLSASAALAGGGAPGNTWGHGHKAIIAAPAELSVNGAAYSHGHKAVTSAPTELNGVNGSAYGNRH